MYKLLKQPDTTYKHVVSNLTRLVLELNTVQFDIEYFRQDS